MKTLLFSLLSAGVLFSSRAADIKVGTVDLQKVITEYYKADAGRKQLVDLQVSFEKEFDGLKLEGQRLAKETENVRVLSLDTALSGETREQKRQEFDDRLQDLRAFELKLDQFRSACALKLQTRADEVNRSIQTEVVKVTAELSEREGFDLILNYNRSTPFAGDVIVARRIEDVTPRVIAALNSTKRQDVTVEKPR